MKPHKIVSEADWTTARKNLLEEKKALATGRDLKPKGRNESGHELDQAA